MDNTSSEKRFALLIDADNVSAKYLKPILDELSKYGTVTYKRIYGDWTLNLHAKWKEALLKNSITPIQQFGYTQSKNATDSAMIIDAMDILYADSVEGFCIVSSDSDFTRLAVRLRESGRMVIGMGEQKTPIPFRTACDVFTTLELLAPDTRRSRRGRKGKQEDSTPIPEATVTRQEIEQAVVDIVSDNVNNEKTTGLGEIGSRLLKMYPDFDVRSYGTHQISKLLSGFASVVLKKVGYNLTVELAEGIEPGTVLTFDSEDETDVEEVVTEAVSANASASSEETDQAETEGDIGGRRRRRRGGRGRGKKAEAVEAADGADAETDPMAEAAEKPAVAETPTDEANKGETPKKRTRRSRKKTVEPAVEEPAAEASPSEPEAAATGADEEAAPKKRTRRTRKMASEAAIDVAAAEASPSEPEAASTGADEEAAPKKRTRRTRKKIAEAAIEEAAAEVNPPEPKAASSDKPEKTTAAASPQPNTDSSSGTADAASVVATAEKFILEQAKKAGAEGISASALSKRVRSRVKGFRLKDLGFKNFREYLDTIGGIAVDSADSDHRVTLK